MNRLIDEMDSTPPRRDYQDKGLRWFIVERGARGILTMEPGTGKTKVAIDAMRLLYRHANLRRVLVTAPINAIPDWIAMLEEHGGDIPIEVLAVPLLASRLSLSQKSDYVRLFGMDEDKLSIILINYESAWRPPMIDALIGFGAKFVLWDESHRIKSPTAKQTRKGALVIAGLSTTRYAMCMTGTPVANGIEDFFAQVMAVDPSVINEPMELTPRNISGARRRFEKRFIERRNPHVPQQITAYKGLAEFRSAYENITFHVPKSVLGLAEPVKQVLHVRLDARSRAVYDQMERESVVELERALEDDSITGTAFADLIVVQILRLRQIANGYLTTDDKEVKWLHRDQMPPKMALLRERLEDTLLTEPHRAVVFSAFRPEADVMVDMLGKMRVPLALPGRPPKRKSISVEQLRGGISNRARMEARRRFDQQDDRPHVMVANLQAASEGANLQVANHVLYYSLNFSYINFTQSLDRLHRSGQQRTVYAWYLLAEDSIDEYIWKKLHAKESIISTIRGSDSKSAMLDVVRTAFRR